MHVLVAMGEAKNDPSTVAYGLARAWSLAGVPVLMIDVDPAGCTLDFRLGNAVRTNLDPIARGLPSLVGGNHPFSVETIAKHTYGLSGNSNLWMMLGPAHPKGSQFAAEYMSENLADLQELASNLKVVVNAGRIPADMPINPAVRPLISAAEPLLVVDSFFEEDGTNFLSRIGVDGQTPADDLFTEDADGEMVPSFLDEVEEMMGEIPPGDIPGKKAKTRGKKGRARGKKAKAKDGEEMTETSVALLKEAAVRKETAKKKSKKSYELLIVADGDLEKPETVEIRVLSRIPALPDLRALAKPRGGQAKRWNAGIVEATQQIDLMFAKEDLSEDDSLDLGVAPTEKIPKVVEVKEVKDAASWWRRRRGRSDADIVDLETVESEPEEEAAEPEPDVEEEAMAESEPEAEMTESDVEVEMESVPEVALVEPDVEEVLGEETAVEKSLVEFLPEEEAESSVEESFVEKTAVEESRSRRRGKGKRKKDKKEKPEGPVESSLEESSVGETAVGETAVVEESSVEESAGEESRSRGRVKGKRKKEKKEKKRKKEKPVPEGEAEGEAGETGEAGGETNEWDLTEGSAVDSEEESVEESSTGNSTSDGQEKGEKDAGNR